MPWPIFKGLMKPPARPAVAPTTFERIYGEKQRMDQRQDTATQRVVDRAASAGKPVAGIAPHTAAAAPRRRDPARPGHFLDEPAPSLSDHVQRNPGSVMPAGERASRAGLVTERIVAADRRGPYAALGASVPPRQQQVAAPQSPGLDAFLSQGAFAALENLITAHVDALLASRTGGADKSAADRLQVARAQFAANYVKPAK